MDTQSKLKANIIPIIAGLAGGLLSLAVLIIITSQMEERTATRVTGGIWLSFAMIQLIIWLRTKNSGYLVWMFGCLAIAFSYLTGDNGIYFFIPATLLIGVYLYFLISRRMRWRYRDILELAARPVKETRNGFTARPFPAGRGVYTKEELVSFGKYLSKNLIAFPFLEKERILLTINGGMGMLFRRPKIQKDTFVSFDFEGRISVNIAGSDYKKYKSDFSFDQLCAALGNLFKTFLGLYQNGKKEQIIPLIEAHISSLQRGLSANTIHS